MKLQSVEELAHRLGKTGVKGQLTAHTDPALAFWCSTTAHINEKCMLESSGSNFFVRLGLYGFDLIYQVGT
ncbi:hypothetical protein AKJ16_DCAP12749 [Drosera capensis]